MKRYPRLHKKGCLRLPLFIVFCVIFSMQGLNGQTPVTAGNVSGNWPTSGSPYLIQGEITIPDGATLSIEPGVRVEFQGHYKLNVQGRLLAMGNKQDSIVFTSRNDTTFWHGIRFDLTPEQNDSSKILYCVIEKSNANSGHWGETWKDDMGGGIYMLLFSKIIISHSTIRYNRANTGGGIYCQASPTIVNTKIIHNKAVYRGGGLVIENYAPKVMGCVISNNSSIEYGGLIAGAQAGTLLLNNTICFNKSTDPQYAPVLIAGNMTIANSIFYYNEPSFIYVEVLTDAPNFYNNNIENGIQSFGLSYHPFKGIYENNIEMPPHFTDTAARNCTLAYSPCINTGTSLFLQDPYHDDLLGNSRIYNDAEARIDIGAYEYQGPVPNRSPYIKRSDEKYLLKNTASKIETIFYEIDASDPMTYKIWEDNPHVSIDTILKGSHVITEISPDQHWKGDFYLHLQANDNAGAFNSVYTDSIMIHIADMFKGDIDFDVIFRDTVKVTGDIVINEPGNLIVDPGTYIEFQGGYKILVFGNINVLGNASSPVIMNTLNDSVFVNGDISEELGWGGIDFMKQGSDTTVFNYCTFKNTGMNNAYIGRACNGTINLYKAKHVFFNHCDFESNFTNNPNTNSGIFAVHTENLIVRNCRFHTGSTSESTAVYIQASLSTVLIDSCTFFNTDMISRDYNHTCVSADSSTVQIKNTIFNNITGRDLIKLSNSQSAIHNSTFTHFTGNSLLGFKNCHSVIENNIFFQNSSSCLGFEAARGAFIRKNLIIDNGYHAILCKRSNPVIINNLIAYNRGVAIDALEECDAIIANNTIVKNSAHSVYYTVGMTYGPSVFVNNIVVENAPEGIGFNNVSSSLYPKVRENIFTPGYVYNASQNYDSIPRFRQNDSLDFNLTNISYAINTAYTDTSGLSLPAFDLEGNHRIDTNYHQLDIGAYEYQGNDVPQYQPVHINELSQAMICVYPNPVSTGLYIEGDVDGLPYSIMDISGKTIIHDRIESNFVNLSQLPKGVYFLRIKANNRELTARFIKL